MKLGNEKEKFVEMNKYEQEQYNKGNKFILGIDEVGRGPLAGEVVIAGVVLNPEYPIYGLNDSKKLNKKKREELNDIILKKSLHNNIQAISVDKIDEIGIANAIRLGVKNIIDEIRKEIEIDFVLIDYMKVDIEQEHLILKKGDQNSNSIAAASIIAKVFRDNLMNNYAKQYPNYGFDTNVGYGTKSHLQSIDNYGIIKGLHRTTFEPIKSLVKNFKGE